MIYGSGLIASAAKQVDWARLGVCVYAQGVSNSGCTNQAEFERERGELEKALREARKHPIFVYFGTCSVFDPFNKQSPYVRHKLEMESMVLERKGGLVARLPVVAGRTSNPHTLLNFIHRQLSMRLPIEIWTMATRYIIDIDDAVCMLQHTVKQLNDIESVVNLTSSVRYSVVEIVEAMASIVGGKPIVVPVAKRAPYFLDTQWSSRVAAANTINFDGAYLRRTLVKYYG